MTGAVPARQAAKQFLAALRAELSGLGVSSDLRDEAGQLRLGVCFGEEGDSELFDSVTVARFRGEWWYCWPEVTPIRAVSSVTGAAQVIAAGLRAGEDDPAGVTDLDAWRMLRQARPALAPGPHAAEPAEECWPPRAGDRARTADRGTATGVAVYWDFEDLHACLTDELHGEGAYRAAWRKPQEPVVDIGAVAGYAATLGRLVVHRAYGNWEFFARYRDDLAAHAVDLIQLYPLTGPENGGGIRLALDVAGDLGQHRGIARVIVVAASRDYTALAQRSRRLGRAYTGIGTTAARRGYELACDEFRLYRDLIAPGGSPDRGRAADRGGEQE